MRKIEQEMIGAIISGMGNFNNKCEDLVSVYYPARLRTNDWEQGNTGVYTYVYYLSETNIDKFQIEVALHGNIIARLSYGEHRQGRGWTMRLENCGYETKTTHSRLNAIIEGITGLSHRFTSKNSSPKTFYKIGYNEPWRMSS